MLHGAGAWFGAESPLAHPTVLAKLGSHPSGIAVAATTAGPAIQVYMDEVHARYLAI
jgi:hypothetical protein